MTASSAPLSTVLAPAVAAARAALRRLEPSEVPAPLRKVAGYTGGRLPPPLEKRLVEHLDGDEWLRDKAARELTSAPDEPDAGRLFLERPDGWWRQLAALTAAEAASQERRRGAQAEARISALEDKLAEARARAAQKRADAVGEADELRRQAEETRDRLGAHQRRAEREVAALRGEIAALGEQRAADTARLQAVAEEATRLRAELREARRGRAAAERRIADLAAPGGAAVAEDAVARARRLDAAATVARRASSGGWAPPAVPPELRLPDGVRPDGPEAIDWLVGRSEPTLVLVDGYNVSFHLDERDAGTSSGRDRVNHDLGRLATMARSLRVVVVYDSSLESDGAGTPGPAGVEIVFAPAGTVADDEIAARAAAAHLPVVVVSSDRAVREAAERVGAVALWSEALTGWIRRRS